MEFKVGDRVICVKCDTLQPEFLHQQGTIIEITTFSDFNERLCVMFDHAIGTYLEWNVPAEHYELAQSYLNEQKMKALLGVK